MNIESADLSNDIDRSDFIDELLEDLEHEAACVDFSHGLVARLQDFVGRLVLGIELQAAEPRLGVENHVNDIKKVVPDINTKYSFLSSEEKKFLKYAIKFHQDARKIEEGLSSKGLRSSWRDDHSLTEVMKLDTSHVIIRCY